MKKMLSLPTMRAMVKDDVLQVAQIHEKELAGFVSQFKHRFLSHFYENTLEVPDMFTFVLAVKGRTVGFVSGTTRVKGMLLAVISKDPLWYILFFMRYFITHPDKIITAIQTLLYPGFSSDEPELLSFAVDKDHRGMGFGKELFRVCAKEFSKRGYRSFLISAYDRLPANGFYTRMGCELIRSFPFHGERMNYYRYRVA